MPVDKKLLAGICFLERVPLDGLHIDNTNGCKKTGFIFSFIQKL